MWQNSRFHLRYFFYHFAIGQEKPKGSACYVKACDQCSLSDRDFSASLRNKINIIICTNMTCLHLLCVHTAILCAGYVYLECDLLWD